MKAQTREKRCTADRIQQSVLLRCAILQSVTKSCFCGTSTCLHSHSTGRPCQLPAVPPAALKSNHCPQHQPHPCPELCLEPLTQLQAAHLTRLITPRFPSLPSLLLKLSPRFRSPLSDSLCGEIPNTLYGIAKLLSYLGLYHLSSLG